ncbi:MAG: Maf family protein [Planctomycetaceae bacterium]|jgi:septum formation protein|nr:Maf family protein [Planctomycetaceae bacterium]
MHTELPLILASGSPRRKQLLTESGFVFESLRPDEHAEDERRPKELPEEYVRRLALQKAKNVADRVQRGIILGCDTIVLCGETLLEKPADRNDARRMLRHLRGQVHHVLSGLCLIKKYEVARNLPITIRQEAVVTQLMMQKISDDEIEKYLDTQLWQGKAGAFGYQDGNDWITILEGSASNVVGLPMELFRTMYGALQK